MSEQITVSARLSDLGATHPFAILDDGTVFQRDNDGLPNQKEGYPPRKCARLGFVFFIGCNTAYSKNSLAQVVAANAPNASALGFSRRMNFILAGNFNNHFWAEFSQRDPGGRLPHDWSKCDWSGHLPGCATSARDAFRGHYEALQYDLEVKAFFRVSDAMRYGWLGGTIGTWDPFATYCP